MERVLRQLKEHLCHQKVLVAVSTGIDSSVLLDLLYRNKDALGVELVVAHVNHQKREQSVIEERYIREYCASRNIRCYVKVLPKHETGDFQEWARYERLAFFNEVCDQEGIRYILFAHHSRDNLETILMRFIRSSSLKGYAGIQEITPFKDKYIYRPFIKTTKAEILRYAKDNDVKYFEDASNHEDYYLRNRIRKYIIPQLEQENPSLYASVNDFSKTLIEASRVVDEQTNKFIKDNVSVHNNIIKFSQMAFFELSPFFMREVLFELLKKYDFSKENIDEMIRQIKTPKPVIINRLREDLTMVKEYGDIKFVTERMDFSPFLLKIMQEGTYKLPKNREIVVKNNLCEFKANNTVICYNTKELPLYVRTKREGDFIRYSQGTKKISDILTNEKVSWVVRNDILLLCDKNQEVTEILGLKVRK